MQYSAGHWKSRLSRSAWHAEKLGHHFRVLQKPIAPVELIAEIRNRGWDHSASGVVLLNLVEVLNHFPECIGLLDDRVKFLKGWFSDTLPTAPIQSLSLLRLDGDLCHAAVDDFRNERGISEPMEEVDFHCVLWQVRPR
jgi:hypothetical protein